MLFLSKFRSNWFKLPSLSVLSTNRPIFLYLFSGGIHENSLFSDIFSENRNFLNCVKNLGIYCYSSDISSLPSNIIDRLEVTTIPVVLGILNGRKLGEVLNNGSHDSFLKLCDKFKSFYNPPESEHVTNLRDLIKAGNLGDLRANLSFVKNNLVRDVEADPALFKLVSEASIICQDDRSVSLTDLLQDLESLNMILDKIETLKLSCKYTERSPKDYLKDLNKLIHSYLSHDSEKKYENPVQSKSFEAVYTGDLRSCYLLKVKMLKLISVKYFIDAKVSESLKYCLEAYKLTVKGFRDDLITLDEFNGCGSREVLGSLFSLIEPSDESLSSARSEVENVLGPRLLDKLPVSTKPKGGVTKKRRGFGGRYIWQGMEYRPKKYKPKNIKQYLNEWRCVQDSNLPSFN